MKGYEATSKSFLLRRTPVIIRIDGKAFHTFTKKFKDVSVQSPFSTNLHTCMVSTTATLVEQIQNCVLAYTQSDEISLLLVDWQNHETQQWFNGGLQKMASVSASIATAAFNRRLQMFPNYKAESFKDLALFDSRVYNLPREEVTNYFIWRQQDASRNSVQMLGHHHFSQKEMHGLNNSQVQDKLMLERNVNWNDLDVWMKRGTCVMENPKVLDSSSPVYVDEDIPIFTTQRNYIEAWLDTEEHETYKLDKMVTAGGPG